MVDALAHHEGRKDTKHTKLIGQTILVAFVFSVSS